MQAVRRADLDDVVFVAEPQAAAVHYATQERLEPGAVVAVYDLGGGTFDVAVLRKTAEGFELIGQPEGIERLGGVDFDEAVFRHVTQSIGGSLGDLDPDDPVAQAAVSRLRDECVAAKEALSSDTEVSIPVLLPNVQTEVRLTRAEFEAMVRPALADTLVVLNRSLRSAGVAAEQLHSVLLVGGSSRIPLVAQLVSAELGRPVALDVHPKHSVAMGAALIAGGGLQVTAGGLANPISTAAPVETAAVPVVPVGPPPTTGSPEASAAASPTLPPAASTTQPPETTGIVSSALAPETTAIVSPAMAPASPTVAPVASASTPAPSTLPAAGPTPSASPAPASTATQPPAPPPPPATSTPTVATAPAPSPRADTSPAAAPPAPTPPPSGPPMSAAAHGGPPPGPTGPSQRAQPARRPLAPFALGAAVAVVVALGVGGWFVFGRGDDEEGATTTDRTEASAPDATTAGTTGGTTGPTTAGTSDASAPPDTDGVTTTAATTTTTPVGACDGVELPCIDIVELTIPPGDFTVEVTWDSYNFEPSTLGLHPHFFWNNATPEQASADAAAGTQVGWEITDVPTYTGVDVLLLANRPVDATGVCVVVGDATSNPPHSVINPDVFECVDLPVS